MIILVLLPVLWLSCISTTSIGCATTVVAYANNIGSRMVITPARPIRLFGSKKVGRYSTVPLCKSSFCWSQQTTTTSKQTALRLRGGGDEQDKHVAVVSNASFATTSSTTNDGNSNSLTAGQVDFSSTPIPKILELFELSHDNVLHSGLTSEKAATLFQQYGPNSFTQPPGKSLLQLIQEQFEDGLVQILLVVALVSGIFSLMEVLSSTHSTSFLKAFVEPIIITTILFLNAIVGVIQSQSAQESLDALSKLQPSVATVLRDSKWLPDVDASTLVPGDVISLKVGNAVPADSRLVNIQTSTFAVDEASLTGESVTTQKIPGEEGTTSSFLEGDMPPLQDQHGMIFSGTMVTSGTGTGLVVRTGMNTEFGKIQSGVVAAQASPTKTPLTLQLDEFASTLTVLISIICVTVFLASIPKFSDPSFSNVWAAMIYYAKVSVALGVAAIPEGLPAVITLCLSLGTRRMAQKNVIVRKLPSVETLGSCNVICTDKTGTLTLNEMTVRSMILVDENDASLLDSVESNSLVKEYKVDGLSYSPLGSVQGLDISDSVVEDVLLVCSLCNDASIVTTATATAVNATGHSSGGKYQGSKKSNTTKVNNNTLEGFSFSRVGEPTEAALCTLVEKICRTSKRDHGDSSDAKYDISLQQEQLASYHVSKIRSKYPRLATLEFSRDRKSMSVLSFSKETNKTRLLVKGAPNLLIDRCTKIKLQNGLVIPLNSNLRSRILEKVTDLAGRPLRCIALAVRDHEELPASLQLTPVLKDDDVRTISNNPYAINMRNHTLLKDPANYEKIESDLTLVGIVGMMDPARPEVAEAMKRCKTAGIRVIMITGDAKDTAIAIARDVNIFPPLKGTDDEQQQPLLAFEGREFFAFPEQKQLEILDQQSNNAVFCRAQPSDKQRLVSLLQSLGYIPAMTGDGVNDAPALQQAAIGISMGITGTEVSKSASDMIITNDDFSTIVTAVEEGRCIYANMQSFINFLISCNIGEVFCILFSTILGVPEPLTAMHLLWVNLVTDGPPATSLGFNPPSDDLMTRKPRKSKEPLLSRWLMTRFCITGLYVGLATVGIFVHYYLSEGISLGQLCTWSKCGTLWEPSASLSAVKTCEDLFQGTGRQLPQTLSLTTLVCMEMFKALGCISVDNSIFKVPPTRNPWLILGVAVPFLLHLGLVYSEKLGIPALGESFGLQPLSSQDWIEVLKWSSPILILDEILKFIGRKIADKKTKEDEGDEERRRIFISS